MEATQPEPEIAVVPEQPTAVIAGVVPVTELAGFFDRSFNALAPVVGRQGRQITGAAFARYHGPPSDTADLEVGFPTDAAVTPAGEVRPGTLPAGRVARLVHVGAYDELGTSWGRLQAWIAAQGEQPTAVLWEAYVTEPSPDMDPADLRTELNWLLA